MIDRRLFLIAFAVAMTGRPASAVEAPDQVLWKTIEAARRQAAHDDDALAQAVTAILTASGGETALAFETGFNTAMRRAYRWDLWAAGYVIHGGMSDDGFAYFRTWLIGQGRAAFEKALSNPDDIVDLVPAGRQAALEMEQLIYAAADAWEAASGKAAEGPQWQSSDGFGEDPTGEPFDEARLAQDYPRLTARFAARPLT